MELSYLTSNLPGIGGVIKERPEDFRVVEIPLYTPSGKGTHVYFGISKTGIPTRGAVERIARHIGVPPMEIGVAGLKDAQAVTEQMMSVEHVDEGRLKGFRDPLIRVLWVSRHNNKLKHGHLAGNRFSIRIRQVRSEALPAARAILEVLTTRGVPNFFGPQRFGMRGDNWKLGAAAIAGRLDEYIHLMLGYPEPTDPPDCRMARELFEQGKFQQALRRWPGHYRNERRALATWMRTNGRAKPTFSAIDKYCKRFTISAFQSYLFNQVLDRRVQQIDTVFLGDLAQKTDSGGVFSVEDEAADQERAKRFEISPTGPLFGYRMKIAEGAPGEIEHAVLEEARLLAGDWRMAGAHKVKGLRRALRFQVADSGISTGSDKYGPYIEVSFVAPPGCYATTLLREITKNDPIEDDQVEEVAEDL